MAISRGEGGVWRVAFRLAGVRVHRSARTRDRRAAEALERRLRAEVHAGRVLGQRRAPEPLSLSAACTRYLEEHIRPTSRRPKDQEWLLCRLGGLLGGQRQLAEIGAADVAQLKARLLRGVASKATVNMYLATLRAVVRKAWREWEAIPSVPPFALYRLQNARTRVLSVDEEARLFPGCGVQAPAVAAPAFPPGHGCPAGGGAGTDLDAGRAGASRPAPHVVFERTKNGDTRSVPLSAPMVEMLQTMRADPESRTSPRVFLCWYDGPGGRRLGPYRRPFDAFRRARQEAGLEDFRIHDLRHTCASRLVQSGVSLFVVGKLLGHRDARMTARYSHLADNGLDAIAELL